jgi:type I restriction enzyme, S subunit
MIPKDWEKLRISEVCKLIVDCVNKTATTVDVETPYRMVRTSNIRDGKLKLDNARYVDRETYDKWTRRAKVIQGDILLTREAPIGEAAIINEETNLFLGQRIMQYRSDHKKLNPKFLYQSFLSDDLQKQFNYHGDIGSTVSHIRVGDCSNFTLLLPPLLEQCRIAEMLGVWDESIDLLEKLIGRIRSRKQGLMQQLLTGKKRFKEFKYSKEDWGKVSFDNCVSSMTSGLSRKLSTQDIGIPVLRSSNIGEKYANFDDLKYWYLEDPQGANTKNYILDDGDILINFINSISQIGKACIFKNCLDRDCIYTTNILRIKPSTRISSDFFYLVTQTEQYRLHIQSITKPAINQASFTTKELKEFTFLLPPIPEQEKIAAVLSAADEEISTLEKQLAAYKQQKLGLMQQLLTGRIRI